MPPTTRPFTLRFGCPSVCPSVFPAPDSETPHSFFSLSLSLLRARQSRSRPTPPFRSRIPVIARRPPTSGSILGFLGVAKRFSGFNDCRLIFASRAPLSADVFGFRAPLSRLDAKRRGKERGESDALVSPIFRGRGLEDRGVCTVILRLGTTLRGFATDEVSRRRNFLAFIV